MNKIVLLSDIEKLPKGAFDFARMLNEQQPVLLTGVFLPKVDYWNTLLYYSFGAASPLLYYTPEGSETLTDRTVINEFEQLCQRNGIEYRVHNYNENFEDVKRNIKLESRFADLLLFSSDTFYQDLSAEMYNEYAEDTMHHAECPIVIVPETFIAPDNIILAYDGSAASVFAIKQFAALLPEFTKLETTLVYVNPAEKHGFPEMDFIEELAERHFSNLNFLKLEIEPEKYFSTWISDRKNTMLVTGAKSRGGLSELFHKSFIGSLMKENMLPIFMAHR